MTAIKSAKAQVTTDLPAAPAVQAKPFSMVLTGAAIPTLHRAAAAIRLGYCPTNIEMYGHTGSISLTLELGSPDPAFVEAVHTEMRESLEREELAKERAIEEAAVRLVAERERAAKKAIITAEIEASEKALRKLKDQAKAVA